MRISELFLVAVLGLYAWFLAAIMFYCLIRVWRQRHWSVETIGSGCLFLSTFGYSGILARRVYLESQGRGFLLLHRHPAEFHLTFLIILTIVVAMWLALTIYRQRRRITDSSVKESIDTLPCGVCCYDRSGRIRLLNRTMNDLSQQMTGHPLLNGNQFRDRLLSGVISNGCEMMETGDSPVVRIYARVWEFIQYELQGDERTFELIALDITEEYEKILELKRRNRELHRMNEQLRRYGETVSDVVRAREILAANTQIHDGMNWLLLSTRHAVEDGTDAEGKQAILTQWKENLRLLGGSGSSEEMNDPLRDLREAAESIGIELSLEGELPEDRKKVHVLMITAGECLTNAVRHGEAKHLVIRSSEDRLEFINDGKPPEGKIRDGGGLETIRRTAAEAGAAVELTTEPEFRLAVIFAESPVPDSPAMP